MRIYAEVGQCVLDDVTARKSQNFSAVGKYWFVSPTRKTAKQTFLTLPLFADKLVKLLDFRCGQKVSIRAHQKSLVVEFGKCTAHL